MAHDQDDETPASVIDARIPITWLVTFVGGLVFGMGGLYWQINSVSAAVTEMRADVKQLSSVVPVQQVQINNSAANITEIRTELNAHLRNHRP